VTAQPATDPVTARLARYAARLARDDPERSFIQSVLRELAALPVTDERWVELAPPRAAEAA
jgi:predicted component of type VI protein secretion system